MSTSNTSSPMDQNVFDPKTAAETRERRKQVIEKSLAKRHRKEKLSVLRVSRQSLLVLHSLLSCSVVFWQKVYLLLAN